eukprot:TRINITY_DN71734_c0_g1_i1.p1 TRINITY_DN71734_c0_g1~~TRINITY_DN71734_c0_g1_i1.p1  ORF type:complete len:514 (-),score=35.69 TRINITY_DN71734_c0_g1_i1:95-1564(-)
MIGHMLETWGFRTFRLSKGSVLPKAAKIAFAGSLLSACFSIATDYLNLKILPTRNLHLGELWTSFASVIGFLLVFRTNQAYSRYWEGITLVNRVRGDWYHAVSSLVSMCNPNESMAVEVKEFQHKLVRLASMLFCCALHQISDLEDDTFEVLQVSTMDAGSLNHLFTSCNDRCEVLVHWMQRLVLDASRANVIDVAPPLLSRPYQEISRGWLSLVDIRKLKQFPFPFPFDQLILLLLCVLWLATALLASASTDSPWAAAGATFVITISYWSLCYTATEIEQPFGDDYNDMNMENLQIVFNDSLQVLLNPITQDVPTFAPVIAEDLDSARVQIERIDSSGVISEAPLREPNSVLITTVVSFRGSFKKQASASEETRGTRLFSTSSVSRLFGRLSQNSSNTSEKAGEDLSASSSGCRLQAAECTQSHDRSAESSVDVPVSVAPARKLSSGHETREMAATDRPERTLGTADVFGRESAAASHQLRREVAVTV